MRDGTVSKDVIGTLLIITGLLCMSFGMIGYFFGVNNADRLKCIQLMDTSLLCDYNGERFYLK